MPDQKQNPATPEVRGALARFEKSLGATSAEHPELTREWQPLR